MNATKPGKAVVRNTPRAAYPNRSPGSPSVQDPQATPGKPARFLRTTVRSLLAVLLIWAGLSKLGDPVSAYTTLLEYQLPAPTALLKPVALVLPWLELLCGLMLVANFHRRLATLMVTVLFGVFLGMVGQAVVRGLDISCGCFNLGIFGIDEASAAARFIESVGFAFFRNLILLGVAIYLLLHDSNGAPAGVNGQEGK